MVNALQRHAAVVVQKSLAEGFGLTVTEAMWKARPIVASAVGGIVDQIVDGKHGVLIADPGDLTTFGATGGGIASYSLSQGLPANSLVTNSYFYTVTKPVAISGTPTIAFTCGGTSLKAAYAWQTESTGSQFVAVGATTAGIANGNANTSIALASACNLYAAIGTASYSAGVIDGYIEYVITD